MIRVVDRMSETSDEGRLIGLAQGGDRAAFDALVRAYFGEVYGLLARMVGNHEDAEDLAQETLVRAFRSLDLYRNEGRFGAWLARIALHLARDHYRRRGSGPVRVVSAEDGDLDGYRERESREPAREVTRKELVRRMGEAVASLPHPLRAALVLRVLEGREYDEVAQATGLQPGTIRTQVMKARRLLLRKLQPWIERNRP